MLPPLPPLTARAAVAIDMLIQQGADAYVRNVHLVRLLPVTPLECADESIANGRRIVRRLERALRMERNRGRDGHWTYDLNRHVALAHARTAERRLLAAVERSRK